MAFFDSSFFSPLFFDAAEIVKDPLPVPIKNKGWLISAPPTYGFSLSPAAAFGVSLIPATQYGLTPLPPPAYGIVLEAPPNYGVEES